MWKSTHGCSHKSHTTGVSWVEFVVKVARVIYGSYRGLPPAEPQKSRGQALFLFSFRPSVGGLAASGGED